MANTTVPFDGILMAQFDIHTNIDPKSRSRTPYILDIQSDHLDVLATRIVVPVQKIRDGDDRITRIHPIVEIAGQRYVAVVSEMAAILARILGPVVATAADARTDIVAAVDLLITGF